MVGLWCDERKLLCHRLPGSSHRRILREHVIKFCTEHGIPLPLFVVKGELTPQDLKDQLTDIFGKHSRQVALYDSLLEQAGL